MRECRHDPMCGSFAEHQERQRDRWRKAVAAHAKAKRRRGLRWRPSAIYKPGMNETRPPMPDR